MVNIDGQARDAERSAKRVEARSWPQRLRLAARNDDLSRGGQGMPPRYGPPWARFAAAVLAALAIWAVIILGMRQLWLLLR